LLFLPERELFFALFFFLSFGYKCIRAQMTQINERLRGKAKKTEREGAVEMTGSLRFSSPPSFSLALHCKQLKGKSIEADICAFFLSSLYGRKTKGGRRKKASMQTSKQASIKSCRPSIILVSLSFCLPDAFCVSAVYTCTQPGG
jgi:hypothetical protein